MTARNPLPLGMTPRDDRPVTGQPIKQRDAMWRAVTHPAFRLGFIDAQNGRPPDHDTIIARIFAETPQTALRRLGWTQETAGLLGWGHDVATSQWRYEEGRQVVCEFGCRARSWNHPDFPPAAVRRLVERLAKERAA